MRVIRAADCRRMPWKNGGGETMEIAAFPDGAGLGAFVWRLSVARVQQNGPFSLFPGIDRSLAVLSGDGLDLQIGETTTRIGPGDAPLLFPGDQPTVGRLRGGPIEDLNIMTRRGVVRHRMRRVAVQGGLRLAIEAATVLVFCATGAVAVGDAKLGPRDTAVLAEPTPSAIDLDGQGTVYLIEIETLPDRV